MACLKDFFYILILVRSLHDWQRYGISGQVFFQASSNAFLCFGLFLRERVLIPCVFLCFHEKCQYWAFHLAFHLH